VETPLLGLERSNRAAWKERSKARSQRCAETENKRKFWAPSGCGPQARTAKKLRQAELIPGISAIPGIRGQARLQGKRLFERLRRSAPQVSISATKMITRAFQVPAGAADVMRSRIASAQQGRTQICEGEWPRRWSFTLRCAADSNCRAKMESAFAHRNVWSRVPRWGRRVP